MRLSRHLGSGARQLAPGAYFWQNIRLYSTVLGPSQPQRSLVHARVS